MMPDFEETKARPLECACSTAHSLPHHVSDMKPHPKAKAESSRRTPKCALLFLIFLLKHAHAVDSVVTFNEIMYHPKGEDSEWIELHNQMSGDVDMLGWRMDGGVAYVVTNNTVNPSKGRLIIDSFTGKLDNAGETIRLHNNSDRLMDETSYSDGGSWPVAPDGSGVSLAKKHPDFASNEPENWTSSPGIGGTPGEVNFPKAGDIPVRTVQALATNTTFRFNESGEALPSDWAQSAHVGGNWQEGPGPLGFELRLSNDLTTALRPPSVNGVITHYFETEFDVEDVLVPQV